MSATPSVFAALLKLVGLRQIEVARKLGVRRSTLAGWLAGYAPMPDDAVLKTHRLIAARLDRLNLEERSDTSAVGTEAAEL